MYGGNVTLCLLAVKLLIDTDNMPVCREVFLSSYYEFVDGEFK